MTKPNIWIFCLEPIDSRYTAQWHQHIPVLLQNAAGDNFQVRQIDGVQRVKHVTSGAFLNFADTNYWKSSQLCKFVELFDAGEVTPNDKFLFTDAWNPVITQIAYMRDLLDQKWELHGIWHAGAYDASDILGYKMQKPWPWEAERSWYHSLDFNYFASEFHKELFLSSLGIPSHQGTKAYFSGQPYEYLSTELSQFWDTPKDGFVIWPHRYNADKQPEIIEDLSADFTTIITQKLSLSKAEYYKTLSLCSVNFSCSLHENLGISVCEGTLAGVIPVVPDRCSYSEMYLPEFKYPSEWTKDLNAYKNHRDDIRNFINERIVNREKFLPALKEQADILRNKFLNSNVMINNLCKKSDA
jgi:hypothetical protein